MQRKGTVRLLTIALVATMLVGTMSSAAFAADARTAKQSVAGEVAAMADTDSWRVNLRLWLASRLIERGLTDDRWVDDSTPADVGTFRADAVAVVALNRAARIAADAESIRAQQAELVAINRGLAAAQLEAATASSDNERRLARAQSFLDRGDRYADADRPARAIRSYMRAWRVATRAIEAGGITPSTPPPPPPPPLGNPAVDVEANYSVYGGAWLPADDAPGKWVYDDMEFSFQFVVSNAGDVELTDISLTDSMFDAQLASSCSVPTLAPGQSHTCVVAEQWLDLGNHVNTATVTATGAGQTVTASNSVYLQVGAGDVG